MAQVLPLEPLLLASARRLVDDPDAARDLVQEAFAKVLSMEGWATIEKPHAYLLRTMRNLSIEHLRRLRILRFEQLALVDGFDIADEAPDAFRILSGQEQMARLKAAIQILPERCRVVFVLQRFEEKSPRDIARQLGVSLSTLEKRLARAHYLLARTLAPNAAEDTKQPAQSTVKAPMRLAR
ncbi:RNA polymerase sigma factor [Caulobacter radicis]|uniref:RNA polymerase sigma factor n=1 Tax=Caulobacter radicis TaxID=2172650 RepID=UPI001057B29C|nr:sigma-70 family RNA polymerase sigma factor [Caulobacter radicis]